MAKMRVPLDFDAVREIALTLPGVEEHTTSRGTSLKVAGRLLACPAIHGSAEPSSLMVRVSTEERERLLATEPGTYYVTEHYVGYPAVLVRLSRVSGAALRDLLTIAAQQIRERKPRRTKSSRTRSGTRQR
jgi:hypothetical protein